MTNRELNFKKGSIDMLVLYMLQDEDMYAFQLFKLIQERSDNILAVPKGAYYPTLYRLVNKRLISSEKRKVGKRASRVYYHLEAAGKKYLAELLEGYYLYNDAIQRIINKPC